MTTYNGIVQLEVNNLANRFEVEQIKREAQELPQETTYQETVCAEESPLRRLIPGYDSHKTLSALFEAALAEAFRQLPEYDREGDQKPLLTRLAENCFSAGILEEEASRWALNHFGGLRTPFLVRQTVQNVYTTAKGFGKKIPMTTEQELSFWTEEFMQRRYEFRYNTMTTGVEYRERNTFCFNFQPLSNHKDLLTDPSGSRRYIVVGVTGPIDCSPVDHEQLYAQAMHLLYQGERYWFDTEDETAMTESNQEFQVMPIAEQLYHEYFRAATPGEECEELLSIEIMEELQKDSKMKVSDCSIIQFGRILQRNGVPCTHTRRGNVYQVVRIKLTKRSR